MYIINKEGKLIPNTPPHDIRKANIMKMAVGAKGRARRLAPGLWKRVRTDYKAANNDGDTAGSDDEINKQNIYKMKKS